jgi:hypothetical protein
MARKRGPFDAVQFTRESAERIAGVVRQAELTPPAASPLTFDKRFAERIPKQVRAAMFSGAWPIGSSKIVTFKFAPTATANVVNLSWPITLTGYVNEDCIVGREGTNWWLVVPKLESRTAVFATQTATAVIATQTATISFVTGTSTATYVTGTANETVVSGVTANTATITFLSDVSVTATLDTADCSISVGVTKSTGSATAVQSVDVSTASVQVATGTATAVFASGSATAAVLGSTASVTFVTGTVTATFLRIRVP